MEVKELLEFGPFQVDLRRRVLARGSEPVPIPSKAFDVLQALLRRPGETVSKDDLMKAVWPDTFVEDGNLTQMVFLLRKALGDSEGGQPFIVTVPRHGYRFVGEVTDQGHETAQPEVVAEEQPSVAVADTRRALLLWVVAGALTVFAAVVTWFVSRASGPNAPFLHVPVTTYRGSEFSPTLSPDGKQVAFVWGGEADDNLDIYITLVKGGSKPLRLTNNPAPETGPAWSPDGSQIAFYSRKSVFLISPLGGAERRLADVEILDYGPFNIRSASLAWSPDGRWLAAMDQASEQYAPGATLINVLTGEKRYLTKPLPPSFPVHDTQYAFSPDSSRLAFVRMLDPQVSEVFEVPVAGGEPVQLTKRNRRINGLAWVPRTREVVFSSEGVLFRMAARPGAAPAQIVQNEDGIGQVAVSQSGRLVFTRLTVDSNIWELAAGDSTPRQLIASTRWDGYPQLSPDGSRIAFSSNRSGPAEIWISDRDGKNPWQLTTLGGTSHSQRWSPDGNLLVFSSLCNENRDIYTVRPDGGAPRRLTTDRSAEGRPSFSRDGKWIYFYSSKTGISQIWKMPVDGGPALQLTRNGGYEAQESWDGERVYFTRGGVIGLASVPAEGGEEKLENEAILSRSWEVTENGIVYVALDKDIAMDDMHRGNVIIGHPEQPRLIMIWNPVRGDTRPLGIIPSRRMTIDTNRWFFANADATRFLWAQNDRQESDLALIENFR